MILPQHEQNEVNLYCKLSIIMWFYVNILERKWYLWLKESFYNFNIVIANLKIYAQRLVIENNYFVSIHMA